MSNHAPETDRRRVRGHDKRELIVDAAVQLIGTVGYAAASTRAIAAAADVPLSLVHYHFGSRAGLLAAVLERENDRLLERQRALFSAPGSLADRWRAAAAYLDDDLASGYVRMLWELWAAGLSDHTLADRWRASVDGWIALIEETLEAWAREHDRPLPLSAGMLAGLVAILYHGIETNVLAARAPDSNGYRELLLAIGDVIERFERA